MNANTHAGPAQSLAEFLRERRGRIAPEPNSGRRRTPGLRREEVATRAGVSITWYTWLEQGRGGPPSDEVLERLSHALELDPWNREVLFLLGRQRPPPVSPRTASALPPNLQAVLDALSPCPAIVKTPLWDVVAWNDAAAAVLGDYGSEPRERRNVLRRLFSDEFPRQAMADWEEHARFAVAVFRVEVARAGPVSDASTLAAELHQTSQDFRRLWAENADRAQGDGVKRLHHPVVGPIALKTSAFNLDGKDGFGMLVFVPQTPADAAAIARLLGPNKT